MDPMEHRRESLIRELPTLEEMSLRESTTPEEAILKEALSLTDKEERLMTPYPTVWAIPIAVSITKWDKYFLILPPWVDYDHRDVKHTPCMVMEIEYELFQHVMTRVKMDPELFMERKNDGARTELCPRPFIHTFAEALSVFLPRRRYKAPEWHIDLELGLFNPPTQGPDHVLFFGPVFDDEQYHWIKYIQRFLQSVHVITAKEKRRRAGVDCIKDMIKNNNRVCCVYDKPTLVTSIVYTGMTQDDLAVIVDGETGQIPPWFVTPFNI